MGRKILGLLFLIIGIFLVLILIGQLFEFFKTVVTTISSSSTSYALGYISGEAIVLILFGTITYFLLKYGSKWVKPKK